jgi:two-component system sensor histidine kinase/response regulator
MSFVHAIRLSIRAKVLLLALGLALPPLVIVSLMGLSGLDNARDTAVQAGTAALRNQAETNLEKRAADKARLYNAALDNVEQQVEGVAAYARTLIDSGPPPPNLKGRVWISPEGPNPEGERTYPDEVARARQFIPLLHSVVQRNPLVNLGYIGLKEGGVVAFDHDIVDILQANSPPFDVRTRSWFIAARDAGHTVWVDTYVDANTKKLTTTCATPLYNARGDFIGVVGFDLLLDTISQDVLQLDLGGGGYAFLMNDHGKVLVRPDMAAGGLSWNQPFAGENLLENSDPKLHALLDRMIRREQGVERLFYQRGNVYLAFAPIESAGWSVGMVIPEAEVIRPAEEVGAGIGLRQLQLRNQIILLVAFGILAVLGLGSILSLRLTRPLSQLQVGAQRIAAGDLSYNLPQTGNDEIGDLVGSFNAMSAALRQKLAELEENLRQLATLNEVSNHFKAILALPQLLDEIPRAVCDKFGFERTALYLLEQNALQAVSASFGPGNEQQASRFIAVANADPITIDSETVEADIVRSGQAVIVDNPWEHPRVVQSKQQITRSESYVQVPIFGHEEKIIGLLSADYHYSSRPVTARDAAQLLTYASMVGLTIENTRLYNELERQVAQRTDELRAALERVKEADRLKGQFLAAISHELRTPLNAIIGFSTVMLDELDGPITQLQREDLKTINQNGRFLLHLINELLDLSRIEAGKLDLDIQPLDVRTLIGEVAETIQGLLHNKSVVLRVALPPTLPRAYGDAGKSRQILLNLLANAVKFTEKGKIVISARCVIMSGDHLMTPMNGAQNIDQPANAHTTNGHSNDSSSALLHNGHQITPFIAISVRDTGIGIAPEDMAVIFEEFRQVSARRDGKRGSGLGLAITRKLIEAHGGRIWVESMPGRGSTFTFTLPCHIESQPEPLVPNTQQVPR